jgi:hypothetical protein
MGRTQSEMHHGSEKIDLPEALTPDIEAEAVRRHISPDAIIREALHLWHANRQPPI